MRTRRATLDGLHYGAIGGCSHARKDLGRQAVLDRHETVTMEDADSLFNLMRLANFETFDTVVLLEVLAQVANVRVVVVTCPAFARQVAWRHADLVAGGLAFVRGEVPEPPPRILVRTADFHACGKESRPKRRRPSTRHESKWQRRAQTAAGQGRHLSWE